MLVLSRKEGECIDVGDSIKILVTRIEYDKVHIGIEAPNGVKILRSELKKSIPQKPKRRNRNG
jgi:carbon storage regulator